MQLAVTERKDMKLHFFGTVSGLRQLPDRTHQSMAFEVNGALYIFDAVICKDASTVEL